MIVLATIELYTLSLHDALPISKAWCRDYRCPWRFLCGISGQCRYFPYARLGTGLARRSEEHTSELQSRGHLVCRLLLDKKNTVSSLMQSHVLGSTLNHTLLAC